MKLRNKKTGEIKDWDFSNWHQIILNPENKEKYECSLNDFIDRTVKFREEWEDYRPAEPLIKDESMREAIRAWANYCGWESFIVCNDHFNNCYLVGYKNNKSSRLEFNNTIAGASKSRRYTLAELCGEEEE